MLFPTTANELLSKSLISHLKALSNEDLTLQLVFIGDDKSFKQNIDLPLTYKLDWTGLMRVTQKIIAREKSPLKQLNFRSIQSFNWFRLST